jgi:hypothetical protein
MREVNFEYAEVSVCESDALISGRVGAVDRHYVYDRHDNNMPLGFKLQTCALSC